MAQSTMSLQCARIIFDKMVTVDSENAKREQFNRNALDRDLEMFQAQFWVNLTQRLDHVIDEFNASKPEATFDCQLNLNSRDIAFSTDIGPFLDAYNGQFGTDALLGTVWNHIGFTRTACSHNVRFTVVSSSSPTSPRQITFRCSYKALKNLLSGHLDQVEKNESAQ